MPKGRLTKVLRGEWLTYVIQNDLRTKGYSNVDHEDLRLRTLLEFSLDGQIVARARYDRRRDTI